MRQKHLKHRITTGVCGFTLLEVLVAFTLLAIAMAVLMQLFSRGVNNADIADRFAKAAMLAESKLASVGVEETLLEGETSGQFDDDTTWQLSVKLYSSANEPLIVSNLEAAAIANAQTSGATLPSSLTSPGTATTTLGNVDVDALMFVRLYEVELRVSFKTDDGRERAVTLNTMKIGPRA
ncbi:MAG: type II secretion system protein [Pseudomonadota bacterium]